MKKIEVGSLELDEMLCSCDAARKAVDAVAKVLAIVVQKPLPKVVKLTIRAVAEGLREIDARLRVVMRNLRVLEYRHSYTEDIEYDD